MESALTPRSEDGIRRRYLGFVRWWIVVGQVAVAGLSSWVISTELRLIPFFVLIALTLLSNVWLVTRKRTVSDRELLAIVVLDTLLLGASLVLYGGYNNPFSTMFLVYVAIAAMVLGVRETWLVFAVGATLYAASFVWYRPLEALEHAAHHHGGALHLQGMLFSYLLTGALVTYFVTRLRRASAQQEAIVQGVQMLRGRLATLTAVAHVTAQAAHELSTPIATMSLALENRSAANSRRSDDDPFEAVLREQLSRCAEALSRLRSRRDTVIETVTAPCNVRQIVFDALRGLPADRVQIDIPSIDAVLPVEGLSVAIHNLIKNALEASPSGMSVQVEGHCIGNSIVIRVVDAGPGISSAIRDRLGEPFVTSKAEGQGLGLGVFTARVAINEAGGELEFHSAANGGTIAEVHLPFERVHGGQ